MKVSIIIPAYNEQNRIIKTLETYNYFFEQKKIETGLDYELLVVINGTTDKTPQIVHELQQKMPHVRMMEIAKGGKGLAIAHGFKNALTRPNDLIGFVDADMATAPDAYYDLIENLNGTLRSPRPSVTREWRDLHLPFQASIDPNGYKIYDGIIASRYMPGAIVSPPRPLIKRWGSKLFFENLTKILFGIHYYDTQCGAKLFKRHVIEKIAPYLSVEQWAFDIELLYLCKRFGFAIKEFPTVWHDQAGSKLQTMRAGFDMLATLLQLRWRCWLKKF